jgi:hypothetical protein
MPADTIIFVTMIGAAFCVFAAVLAWGERQTRSISSHKHPSQGATDAPPHVDLVVTLAQRANNAAAGKRSPDRSAA